LGVEVTKVLGPENPFWSHACRRLWIAERDGKPVGRIAAIIDETHQRIHSDRTAFFGFFESVDDPAVARALFDAAGNWARTRGCDRLLGPMNPSINEECGLLVSGFERPNAVMMPHNPPFFPALIEGAGFSKAKDLVSFDIALADCPAEWLERFKMAAARRARNVKLRGVTTANLGSLLPALKEIYNAAWERNWCSVPMTPGEIDVLAARLTPLVLDGLVWLAEVEGKAAGLLLAVPDVNEALKPLRGRLMRPAFLGALPVLLGWRRPRRFRLIALGVKAEHRGRGIEGMMFAETLAAARRLGFERCDASWVLEDNRAVHQLAAVFHGRIVQGFRIYARPI